jgi:hypothetical protein
MKKYTTTPPSSIVDFEARRAASAKRNAEMTMKAAIARGVDAIEQDQIIKKIAKDLGVTVGAVTKQWRNFAAQQQRQSVKSSAPTRDELYASCRSIAENPQLLEDMADVAEQLGVVNDRQGTKAIYLAATSRLCRRAALSLLRRGAASSGKSKPITIVLMLIPGESVLTAASGSPKSLPYYGGNDINALKHKIIYIPEAASIADKGGAETEYTIMLRILISEGRIIYQTVVISKDGGPKTITIEKEGPIAVIVTSARNNIEDEMLTRLVVSDADETDEQTNDIIRRTLTKRGEVPDCQPWVDFQRWLELGGPYEVVIPFLAAIRKAHKQSDRKLPLRYRRDLASFITAIEASAIVHSAQRRRDADNCIIAEMVDYEAAFDAFDCDMNNLYEVEHDTTSAGTFRRPSKQ